MNVATEEENLVYNLISKIKQLQVVPYTEIITSTMIAEYFEVSDNIIRKAVSRHKEYFLDSGIKHMSFNDIKEEIMKNNSMVEISPKSINISPAGVIAFNYESMIVLSFLLTKSDIAKRVREEVIKDDCLSNKFSKYITKTTNSLIKENEVYRILKSTFDGVTKVSRQVKCGDYYIDFTLVYNGKKIAIECDEYGHSNYDSTQEKQREKAIKSKYDKLIRFNPDNEDCATKLINKILKSILN